MYIYIYVNVYIYIMLSVQALQHAPRHPKALYRRGAARAALGETEGAIADLTLAAELTPGDTEVCI